MDNPSEYLKDALEANRRNIEEGLVHAEQELATLRERELELEALIARAKAALGEVEAPTHRATTVRRTLHEAIALVLSENGNRWMTVRELSDEVNRRRLYTKQDGSLVEVNQIHARTKNYASLFEKDGPHIRLLKSEEEK